MDCLGYLGSFPATGHILSAIISAADDFEEIDFDKSDDETKFDGFEEVELPEEREPLGTKRCQCQCHSTGDDNYRKRKKHCLSCCLTVS